MANRSPQARKSFLNGEMLFSGLPRTRKTKSARCNRSPLELTWEEALQRVVAQRPDSSDHKGEAEHAPSPLQ
jgi:hypothetical protein